MEDAVALAIPGQIAAHVLRRVLRQQPPAFVDHASLQKHGDEVDQSRAADALCLSPADNVAEEAPVIAHMAHRARDARHAAADARALKRWARGDRAAERATLISQRHLAVRADIEKQPQFRLHKKAVCQQFRRDIAADIARDARGKLHGNARKRLARAVFKQRLRLKRRAGDGRDLAPVEKVLHHGIARNDEFAGYDEDVQYVWNGSEYVRWPGGTGT